MYQLKSHIPLFLFLAMVSFSFTPAKSKWIEASFWVNRDCEMCKATILSAADLKGVKSASYDMDSYMITVVYNPSVIAIEKIHESIANRGYDTSLTKAPDAAYNSLPGCCQYDRSIQPKK